MLETILAPFVKDRPVCVKARAVLERLWDAPRLDALLARPAPQPYTRERLLSSLGQRMSAVVLGAIPWSMRPLKPTQRRWGGTLGSGPL